PQLAHWCMVSLRRSGRLVPVAVAGGDPGEAGRRRIAEISDAMPDEQRALVRELGARSVMLVPITTPEDTVGVLSLVGAESHRRFSDADLALAEELGRRAGIALENARLHTELGHVARTLQHGLLPPDLPAVPGWS